MKSNIVIALNLLFVGSYLYAAAPKSPEVPAQPAVDLNVLWVNQPKPADPEHFGVTLGKGAVMAGATYAGGSVGAAIGGVVVKMGEYGFDRAFFKADREAKEKAFQQSNQKVYEDKVARELTALSIKDEKLDVMLQISKADRMQKDKIFNNGWQNAADVIEQVGNQSAAFGVALYNHSQMVQDYRHAAKLEQQKRMHNDEMDMRAAEMAMRAAELSERSEKHKEQMARKDAELAIRAAELQLARENSAKNTCALM
jgi:hypothetical protein